MGERRVRFICLGIMVLALSCPALADRWPLGVPKGSVVVATIPRAFWQVDKYDSASSGGQLIYFVNVEDVLSQPGWRASGFPYCGDFTLTKITKFKPLGRLRYTIVELRNSTIYLKLRFPPGTDLRTDFQRVVTPGDWQSFKGSKDFRDNVLAPQGAGIFTGPLARLPEAIKLSLFGMVCSGQGTLGTTEFKGRTYLAVTLGDDGTVYNTVQLNQSARVAKVINDRLLDDIKAFQGVASLVGIDGVEFTVQIYFRNLVSETLPTIDKLELYVPLGLASKFADQDITSQQLMDGSVIILNGNRIQVSLAF
ncbi:MAG TPA: hypothetical protein VNE63_15705 [Candidatus Acidoferrales bacterium]|nr:hypothetical protein [Candidatus Acidoferrales bacterium]